VELVVEHAGTQGGKLHLSYVVFNGTEENIWLCNDMDVDSPIMFETVADLEGETLFLRLRLDMPMGWWRERPPIGRYVRLLPGQSRAETLWLTCPVRQQPVLTGRSAHHPWRLRRANSLVLEIGYFTEDLPERMLRVLDQGRAEEDRQRDVLRKLAGETNRLKELLRSLPEGQREEPLRKEEQELRKRRDSLLSLVDGGRLWLEEFDTYVEYDTMWYLEECHRRMPRSDGEVWIPQPYPRDVEKERLLTSTTRQLTVPHFPPRYLTLSGEVPWGIASHGPAGMRPEGGTGKAGEP
jgi:hypothetical protein